MSDETSFLKEIAMYTRSRLSLTLASMAVAVGLIYLVSGGSAGEPTDIKASVVKIGESFKKDQAAGTTDAQAYAKKLDKNEAVADVMNLFQARKAGGKGGLGVGKMGTVTPDGISVKLISLGRDVPSAATLTKEGDALEEMGYNIAAIAEITAAFPPTKDVGKQTKADWLKLTAEVRDSGIKLAEAAKSKVPNDVKTAASKINAACNSCHTLFRD